MKVTIDTTDLKTLVDGLNNAILAYKDIRNAVYICGHVPNDIDKKWEPLVGDNFYSLTDELDRRLEALYEVYEQLVKYEEEIMK